MHVQKIKRENGKPLPSSAACLDEDRTPTYTVDRIWFDFKSSDGF